ncbi:MAG TPA: outer membrane beta-barrel protein [Agriterribacter sp.]|nr:porin [Chitinophagaceae bacterium]HRP32684.1 outer membrane beta-barrel protein [Agriterribacter sp.]
MLRKFLTPAIFMASFSTVYSQDSTAKKGELTLSGSVDGYYRYNVQNAKGKGATNDYTSFTNSQNSFELGMASLKAEYKTGKVSATIDVGLGTRAREFSYNETGVLAAIKQTFISYSPTEKLKFTIGKWATHVGYELLDPQLNRNYSMSYMFSYGPFSHTGIKAEYGLGDHFGVMLGVANPTDYISAGFSKKYLLGQFSTTFDKFSAFLNYAGGRDFDNAANHQLGLTATSALSDKISLGYDGTVKFYNPKGGNSGSWWGSALYLNIDPTEKFGFTLRGEYFDDKKGIITYMDEYNTARPLLGSAIVQTTLSFNIKPVKNLTIIPEFRIDSAEDPIFTKHNGTGAKSTGSFLLAGIFSF